MTINKNDAIIKDLRHKLENEIIKKDANNPQVIKLSKELDSIINQYYKHSK